LMRQIKERSFEIGWEQKWKNFLSKMHWEWIS
jgi:hypothetical protein